MNEIGCNLSSDHQSCVKLTKNGLPEAFSIIPRIDGHHLFVPQAVSAARSSLDCIPSELEEVGYSLGGSRLAILWYVTLPLMRPGLVAGGLLVFLTVMKELPVTLLLSPIGFSTLPTLVWANISEAFFARAAAPTLLLLLLSSVPLAWVSMRDNRD